MITWYVKRGTHRELSPDSPLAHCFGFLYYFWSLVSASYLAGRRQFQSVSVKKVLKPAVHYLSSTK